MKEKAYLEELLRDIETGSETLGVRWVTADLRILAAAFREMQELLVMASELSWAIGQDDVGDEWPKLCELEERLQKFHKPSWDKRADISPRKDP